MYNTLPTIAKVTGVAQNLHKEIAHLRAVIQRQDLQDTCSVRLIHKHFDLVEGEIMVFGAVPVAGLPGIMVMTPAKPDALPIIKGLHYYVGESGQLEPYKYTGSDAALDISKYPHFLEEFAALLVDRGVQGNLGLAVALKGKREAFQELEARERRSTLLIPAYVEMPPGYSEARTPVITDWPAEMTEPYMNVCYTTGGSGHGAAVKIRGVGNNGDGISIDNVKLDNRTTLYRLIQAGLHAVGA
jgi:hypothetical protein